MKDVKAIANGEKTEKYSEGNIVMGFACGCETSDCVFVIGWPSKADFAAKKFINFGSNLKFEGKKFLWKTSQNSVRF